GELSGEVVRQAVFHFRNAFDEEWGGFGGAPKFPRPMILSLLLRRWRRTNDPKVLEMATVTLDKMADGGLYDHVGGGIARYSVDERWMIPHFEKMLYDNALLAAAYAEGYQATGRERYAAVVREVLAYILRDMTHPEGGFYSAQDADSEGEEGKYYVWTEREIREVLGADLAPAFIARFNITAHGNFEHGTNNPWITRPLEDAAADLKTSPEALGEKLAEARRRLFEARSRRVPPLKDDKILAAWNGLMISGFCKAAQALGDAEYAEHARRAADFVLGRMTQDGRLLRRWREGEAKYAGYLNDYAFFTQGLLDLYETTFETARLAEALRLTDVLLAEYADPNGGFYGTGDRNEKLLVQSKDAYDGAIPSGNSVATMNLLRLAELTGERRYEEAARRAMLSFRAHLEKIPTGYPLMLCALDYHLGEKMEVVLAGDLAAPDTSAMIAAVHRPYLPNKVVSHASPGAEALMPPLAGKTAQGGKATAYVCRDYACRLP
ncbi:MAG: thioredoxin domain-containing protein, partial [Candidatus Methylomirabilis sp.]|nr:thioredoxin domain-containing protein [Deltaproteobacteria bacterium]